MPCKAHNLQLYPYTLITLDDRQTQNKEFPVVAILLQGFLETLFWKGAETLPKRNPAQPAKLDAIVPHEIRVKDIGKGKKNSMKLMFSFGIKAIQTYIIFILLIPHSYIECTCEHQSLVFSYFFFSILILEIWCTIPKENSKMSRIYTKQESQNPPKCCSQRDNKFC
jgi:hypothetical protein